MSELVSAWRSPRRSIATSSTTRSDVSTPLAPAFMPQRPADAAGDAVIEGEATECRPRRACAARRLSAIAAPTRMRFPSTSILPKPRGREAHDDPIHAAVADEQVRAEPDDGDGNFLRHRAHQELQVLHVGGHRQDLGGPAGPEPDDRCKRLVGLQGAAEAGEFLAQPVEEVLRHRDGSRRTHLSSGGRR